MSSLIHRQPIEGSSPKSASFTTQNPNCTDSQSALPHYVNPTTQTGRHPAPSTRRPHRPTGPHHGLFHLSPTITQIDILERKKRRNSVFVSPQRGYLLLPRSPIPVPLGRSRLPPTTPSESATFNCHSVASRREVELFGLGAFASNRLSRPSYLFRFYQFLDSSASSVMT
jgi:hypothetical protein